MKMKKTQKYFISENYYRQIVFTKENSYYAMEHQKKNDLLLLTTKLTRTKKTYLMLVMIKNTINHF